MKLSDLRKEATSGIEPDRSSKKATRKPSNLIEEGSPDIASIASYTDFYNQNNYRLEKCECGELLTFNHESKICPTCLRNHESVSFVFSEYEVSITGNEFLPNLQFTLMSTSLKDPHEFMKLMERFFPNRLVSVSAKLEKPRWINRSYLEGL